jgi:hypothetical protein
MAWGKAGSTTLSSSAGNIDSGTLSANKFLQFQLHTMSATAEQYSNIQCNSDTGSNYAQRYSTNGGADAFSGGRTEIIWYAPTNASDRFMIGYVFNISGEEKLFIGSGVASNTAGAGNAPERRELTGKWANTSAQITSIKFNATGSWTMATDTNLSVLGSDITPAEAVTFPSDVPDYTRFEETDTRKMYSKMGTRGWYEKGTTFEGRGVFGGGYQGANENVIDYITISTLGNATDFGDLSESRRAYGSVANDTRGLFGGGYGSSSTVDTIDYITIANLGNATDFGNLTTSNRAGVVGAGNDTRGLFAGGESSYSNVIDYVTIANLGNATDFGNLTVARKQGGATSDKTKAVFIGGEGGETTMDYVTIATPSNAVSFGTFTQGSYGGHCGTISNGTRGIFAIGGSTASGGYNNTIIYITIATPSVAEDFGDLTQGRSDGGQVGDSTRGVFGGGKYQSGSTSGSATTDYITIATLGNATDFGDLTSARYALAGVSDNI